MSLHEKTTEFLASRAVRLHHHLWHQIRDTWNWARGGMTEVQKKKIEELGWKPDYPSQDANRRWDTTGPAGEDFLFMHRQMIKKVKEIQSENGGNMTSVSGWASVPSPNSSEFSVPEAWEVYGAEGFNRFLKVIKSDDYYYMVMREWQRTYTDKSWLKGKTLAEVGAKIESTIHNMMHMRWCDRPWDPRTGKREESIGQDGNDISKKWDDPRANWLGHTYSSHVNPVFWKLHGWVDDRTEDWYEANKDSSNLEKVNLRGVDWYKGELVLNSDLWTGGMDFGHEPSPQMIKKMEEVSEVLFGKNDSYHFYDL